jgi:hypothetical protein
MCLVVKGLNKLSLSTMKHLKGVHIIYIFSFLLLLRPMFCSSQSTFFRTYGGVGNDKGWYVIEDSVTGDFVICGDTGSTSSNFYYLKLEPNGNPLWTKTFPMYGSHANCVLQTSDGGYFLFGDGSNFGHVALGIKTDSVGDTLWTFQLLGSNQQRWGISCITVEKDNILLGTVNDDGGSYNPYQILKIDSTGGFIWLNYVDMINSTYFGGFGGSLKLCSDGGYIVGGTNEINGQTQDVMSITKSDSSGAIQWQKEYGGIGNCDGGSIWECKNSGYVIAGYTDCYGVGGADMYVIRTDHNGDSVWAKTFGGSGNEGVASIQETSDGGFVVFGDARPGVGGNNDIVLLRLDANGDSLWEKTFGGSGDDIVKHGIITRDGGFAMVGSTTSYGAGGYDVYFIKTDSLGILTNDFEFGKILSPISIYPNPFTEQIKVESSVIGSYQIEIFDYLGNYIFDSEINQPEFIIDTSEFPSGIYVARMFDRSRFYFDQIIVKF